MEKIKFLDMEIQDSGNSDGVTLVINGCSYGNFGKDWGRAKLYALKWFMILRPQIFGHSIINKLNRKGSGTCHEYFLLKREVEKLGLEMPKEITCVDSLNAMIGFNGEVV